MSRIGKAPIALVDKVELSVDAGNMLKVKGPKGELYQQVAQGITVKVEGNEVIVSRATEQKRHKALHGLTRALVANMIEGVTKGYTKDLELVGVGYRATATGQNLELAVGYSHPVIVQLPKEVKVSAKTEKGKNPIVSLESIDKQLIGQVAATIRKIRKPEPYKGKGIRFLGEEIRRKAGKAAGK